MTSTKPLHKTTIGSLIYIELRNLYFDDATGLCDCFYVLRRTTDLLPFYISEICEASTNPGFSSINSQIARVNDELLSDTKIVLEVYGVRTRKEFHQLSKNTFDSFTCSPIDIIAPRLPVITSDIGEEIRTSAQNGINHTEMKSTRSQHDITNTIHINDISNEKNNKSNNPKNKGSSSNGETNFKNQKAPNGNGKITNQKRAATSTGQTKETNFIYEQTSMKLNGKCTSTPSKDCLEPNPVLILQKHIDLAHFYKIDDTDVLNLNGFYKSTHDVASSYADNFAGNKEMRDHNQTLNIAEGKRSIMNFDSLPLNTVVLGLEDGIYVDQYVYKALYNYTPPVLGTPDTSNPTLSSHAIPSSTTQSESHNISTSDSDMPYKTSNTENATPTNLDVQDGPVTSSKHKPNTSQWKDLIHRYPFLQAVQEQSNIVSSMDELDTLQQEIEVKRRYLAQLKKERDNLRVSIQSERDICHSLEITSNIMDQHRKRTKLQQDQMYELVRQEEKNIEAAHDDYYTSTLFLTQQQLGLVAELRHVYPIECKEKDTTYTIRGLPLPTGEQMQLHLGQEQLISTALGYTTHVVCLLAKYMRVPLRYFVRPMASRSQVRDDVISNDREYPLYWKERDATVNSFRIAYAMLQRNVLQLLWAVGVAPPNGGRHILESLDVLFQHLVDPDD